MRGLWLFALCACVSPQPPPGSAGPEEAVKEFAAAVQKGDAATATSMVPQKPPVRRTARAVVEGVGFEPT